MKQSFVINSEDILDWNRFLKEVLQIDRYSTNLEDIGNPHSLVSRMLVKANEEFLFVGTILLDFVDQYMQLIDKFKALADEHNKDYQEYLRLREKFKHRDLA